MRKFALYVTILFAASLIFRIYLIFLRVYPSYDEIWAYFLIRSAPSDIWFAALSDFHGPFYFLFLHFVNKIVSLDVFGIRVVSLIFGISSSFALFFFVKSLYREKVAWIALLVSLYLPAFIWPSIFARYYAFLILLSVLLLGVFLKFYKNGGYLNLVLATLFFVVGVYTHYYFVFYFLCFLFFLLLQKKKKLVVKRFIFALIVAGILLLPLAYFFYALPKPEIGGRHANSIYKIPAILVTNNTSWEVLTYLYTKDFALTIGTGTIAGIASLMLIYKGYLASSVKIREFLLSLVVVPPALTVVYAYSIKPLLALGSLQIFLVPLVTFYALAISKFRKRVSILGLALVALFGCVFLYQSSLSYSKPQQDLEFILNNFQERDIVVHSHIYSFIMGRYYFGKGVNFGSVDAFSATGQTEKALGYVKITRDLLLKHRGRIWYVGLAYDTRPESRDFFEFLSNNFRLVKEDSATVGNVFQDSDFDIYLYE